MGTRRNDDRLRILLKVAMSAIVAALAAYLAFSVLEDRGWLFYVLLVVLVWNVAEVVIHGGRLLRRTGSRQRLP